jgi:hypothetical protein
MRIRVSSRADLFEKRKQQHIERGYRIEDERPIPVNGLSSFVAVTELPERGICLTQVTPTGCGLALALIPG